MTLFSWSKKFSVNLDEMDNQHKQLLGYLNELYDAVVQHKGERVIGKVVDALESYSQVHFADEEWLLEAVEFPELELQRAQHRYFTEEVGKMKEAINRRHEVPPQSLLYFLRNWFLSHIFEEDKKYGEIFADVERGLPRAAWSVVRTKADATWGGSASPAFGRR
jgi:hemerythrin